MNRKKRIIIGVIIGIILLLIITGVIFIFKSRPKTESDKEILDSQIPDSPGSGSSSGSTNNSFPLTKGMRGNLVTNVQAYLASNAACINSYKLAGASIPATDGVFGPITEKALKSCKGVTVVTQELYNEMMKAPAAAATAPTSGFKKGDKLYLAGDQSMIFSFPENKPAYFVGRVSKTLFLANAFGVYDSDAANGFSKITVAGYEPYNKTTGGYNTFKTVNQTVYIYKSNLRKTPY